MPRQLGLFKDQLYRLKCYCSPRVIPTTAPIPSIPLLGRPTPQYLNIKQEHEGKESQPRTDFIGRHALTNIKLTSITV